jgi:putative FmdB family regulatory protein
VPRYAFGCQACGLEFEVSRPMSEAGRPAVCPEDGAAAERIFTAPMTAVRQGGGPPAGEAPAGPAARSWSSPFFPKGAPAAPASAPDRPRHVLPAGSSKPARFRHFGHWHPAGTPVHTHRSRRAAPAPDSPAAGA